MELRRVPYESVDWARLNLFSDRNIFQTREWLEFIAKSQGAQPVIAELRVPGGIVGVFTGLIVSKFGLRILGSPFAGWTTDYLGFNLNPEISPQSALRCLEQFAFDKLRCVHLEIRDRGLRSDDVAELGFDYREGKTYEVDLGQSEAEIFAAFDNDVRRCIRKSQRDGVIIEEAKDPGFADDYYAQLEDVFAKQKLAPTYGRQRVRLLYEHLYPTGKLLLLRAKDPSGHCIATGIFPAMNDTMYFWGGASWRRFQYLHPNDPIQWYAMRYWKQRSITRYDMGGSGKYKMKYGGTAISVPWLRKSKHLVLARMRELARRFYRLRQRLKAKCVN